jgi:DNA-binding transcriptional ArsR family regulator
MRFKTMSALNNPVRLKLLSCLGEGPKSVNELIGNCQLSQSAVSQHLQKLREAGLVLTKRRGKEVIYSISNPKVLQVSSLILNLEKEQI